MLSSIDNLSDNELNGHPIGTRQRETKQSLAEFRLIPRIETFPAVVSFVQTPLGKIVLLAVFGSGMRFFLPDLPSVFTLMLPMALITFLPEYRRFVLAVTPIVIVVVQTASNPLLLGLTLSVIALGILLYWCAMPLAKIALWAETNAFDFLPDSPF